jgi:TonB family protein
MLPFLAGQALASTAVLLVATGVCTGMRRSSAAQRHLVWLLAFTTLLIMPAYAWLIAPYVPRITRPKPVPVVTVTVGPADVTAQASAGSQPSRQFPWTTSLVFAWGLGTSWLLLRTMAGLLICARRRRRAIAFPDAAMVAEGVFAELDARTPAHVLAAPDVSMPETFGLFEPVVLLPLAAREWSPERVRVVLLHEMVHVKRGDWAVQVLARIAVALFWFNPLAWYGLARLRHEQEMACDDEVLRFGIGHSRYADELLQIARCSRAESAALAIAMARAALLEHRIHNILNPQIDRRRLTMKRRLLCMFAAAFVAATVSLVTAPAQTGNASVAGTVRDPSGAVIPNATVILFDANGRQVVQTNEVGAYALSGVPAGKYSLIVQQPGFRQFNKTVIAVADASASKIDVTLDIGRISERMEVTAQGKGRPQPETHLTSLKYSLNPESTGRAQSVVPSPAGTSGPGPSRVRVGGNIRPAKLLKQVRPQYPGHLVAKGVEGTVLLEAVVGTNGEMLSVETHNSSVDPDLIKAAIDAVQQWQYEPTLLNGQPVEIVTTVTVDFRLQP